MKLTCHSCGAKYTVSDDKIQGKTVKMKCRKCGSTIVVGGAQADASAAGGDDASPPAGSFLVNVTDGDQRTMTLAEIVDAYRAGVVTDDTYVWADGMTDWQAVAEHAEVSAAVRGAGAPAAPAQQPSMHSVPEMDAFPAAAAAPAPAARKEPKASRDLFGEDRPSSGGLFGGGGGGGLAAAPSPSGTGKRDENSVLFSLSALTSVEASAPAAAGKTTAKKDDSGLIDLKALAASAPATPAASGPSDALLPDAGAVFPLGMPILAPPPPAAPPVGMDVAPPPAKSKLPIILGSVVGLAAIVGVFFLVKGDPPPPPAPTPAQTAAPAPAPTPEPAPVATAEPSAEPSASASASAAPVAAGPKGKWPPPGKGTGAKPPSGGASPPGGGEAPKPPPAKSKCGCAPTDLMCNMKCSAGK